MESKSASQVNPPDLRLANDFTRVLLFARNRHMYITIQDRSSLITKLLSGGKIARRRAWTPYK